MPIKVLLLISFAFLSGLGGSTQAGSPGVAAYTIRPLEVPDRDHWPLPRGIENDGTVVGILAGNFAKDPEDNHGAIWKEKTFSVLDNPEASRKWGSVANAISKGRIVGGTFFNNKVPGRHACEWSGGKIRDLGTLEDGLQSEAMAVNRMGRIVGYATGTTAFSALHNGRTAFSPCSRPRTAHLGKQQRSIIWVMWWGT
jgi:uncharacterized membrane protein